MSRSRSRAASAFGGSTSDTGLMRNSFAVPVLRWVRGSKLRRLSTRSPSNSARIGSSASAGKTSRMKPRRAICPGATTGSLRT